MQVYWRQENRKYGCDARHLIDSKSDLVASVALPAVADPSQANQVARPVYRYGYDIQGQQTSIIDPLGRHTQLEYDLLGRQTERYLPLHFGEDGIPDTADDVSATAFHESYRYDELGRQYLHVSFEGVYTRQVYDELTGRILETQYFSDAASFNAGVPDGRRVFEYDDRGRVVRNELFAGAQSVRVETTSYNELGLVDTETSPEGVIHYEYNVFGQVWIV